MDRNLVTRVHEEWAVRSSAIGEHGVKRGVLMKHTLLARGSQPPDGRADRICVGGVLHDESTILRATAYDRVRVELQLHKRLPEDAPRVRDRAAEPKGGAGSGNEGGAVARKNDGPGQFARGAWRARDGI